MSIIDIIKSLEKNIRLVRRRKIVDALVEANLKKYGHEIPDIDLEKIKSVIWISSSEEQRQWIQYLFKSGTQQKQGWIEDSTEKDVICKWGMKPTKELKKFPKKYDRILFFEDSFLRSLTTFADFNADLEDRLSISCVIDHIGFHFNCDSPSRLEMLLNSGRKLSNEEVKRARKNIDKIIKNHLTKYNHQPIYTPKIGRDGVKKVLVIDQSAGDYSVLKGGANAKTFKNMLQAAIKENPAADIIVKVHPDALTGGDIKGYYFRHNTNYQNVYLFAEEINPIATLQYVNKVYVCSSGMGFEAVMCGKEVVTFGVPFYSGWGLTDDRNKILKTRKLQERRNKIRTIEEVFFFTYIIYSHYVNPKTKKECTLEDAIDFLIEKRKEFVKRRRNK
jgi:capsular polysaccharide export protein